MISKVLRVCDRSPDTKKTHKARQRRILPPSDAELLRTAFRRGIDLFPIRGVESDQVLLPPLLQWLIAAGTIILVLANAFFLGFDGTANLFFDNADQLLPFQLSLRAGHIP